MGNDDGRLHIIERLNDIDTFKFDTKITAEKRFREFVADISKSGIEAKKTKKAALRARRKDFERLRDESRRRLGVTDMKR